MAKSIASGCAAGMDNVRNMTGSPIAGIDPHELLDVRPLNYRALPVSRPHPPVPLQPGVSNVLRA